jgi:hypothetical protein
MPVTTHGLTGFLSGIITGTSPKTLGKRRESDE